MRAATPLLLHHCERRLPAVRVAGGTGRDACRYPCIASACANSKFGASGFVSAGAGDGDAGRLQADGESDQQQRHAQLAELQHFRRRHGAIRAAERHRRGAQPDQRRQSEPDLRRAQRQRPGLPHQSERHRLRQRRPGERRRAGGLDPEHRQCRGIERTDCARLERQSRIPGLLQRLDRRRDRLARAPSCRRPRAARS